ncbi:CHASE2 domain-containing protein [Prevotella sp. E13-27]|uniref:CHASE2 domain-containing protein n=1 Tax=Prevotella sp. E13-27 TaxID=2938122 RepID=UPI00200A9163|nr:CHASE2 domain-containing protein [Prevotella sp. E13-27]MCK8621052.1 CHASE2 domain-containing protein [Prevotella sp. E13-27]
MAKKTIKQRIKAMIGKSILLKSLIISFLAFGITCVLYFCLGNYLSYLGIDKSNLSYLKEYYKTRNTSYKQPPTSNDIYIIEVYENSSHDSVAKLVDAVCAHTPAVVGIDIRFTDNFNASDDTLRAAIKRNADLIVLAQVLDDDGNVDSNLFENDSLHFGIANSYDVLQFPDSTYHHFAYEVSKKYKQRLFLNYDDFLINYSTTDYDGTDMDSYLNSTPQVQDAKTKGKIVLIGGDVEGMYDRHQMPFNIDRGNLLPGIYCHAYAINSLINPNLAMKRLSIESKGNILLYWFLCFTYSFLYVCLTDKKCKYVKKYNSVFNIIRPLLLLMVVPILLLACFFLTLYCNIVPNVVPFLISVFIIITFNDFLAQNINSEKYE